MKYIVSFLKPYKGKVALAILFVAVSTICNLLLPTLMSQIVDVGIYNADLPYIVRCCAAMLVVALVSLGTVLAGSKLSSDVVAWFSADLRTAIYRKVNSLTFEEFGELGTAALVTRSTHDVSTVSWVASMLAGSIVTIPVLFIGGFALSLAKDVVLSLILLAFVCCIFVVVFIVGKRIGPLWETADKYMDKQNDIMRERLHGIRVIRAFNSEPREHKRVADATQAMAKNIIRANVSMQTITPLAMFVLNAAVLVIVYTGASRMERGVGSVSAGDIFAIVQYVTLVLGAVIMAAFAIVMYPHAKVAADRIGQVIHAEGMADPIAEQDYVFTGDIAFEHVGFRYDNASESAVSDVSFHITPGQKVSLIGGTGSGKSTLVQLLLGFRAPTEGVVRFDGMDAENLSRKTIRRNISCVLQKTAVYSGTVRENILMGAAEASDAQLRRAAEIAELSGFVDTLADGYDHKLEQSGKNLSGGQKQRLAIARAVIKDAPIYIFDDSFSALDFLTESRLRGKLNAQTEGRTQLVITQRVTTAMDSDLILVMDRGRLVDSGRHPELLERCAIYREIYLSQTGGERP